MKPRNEFRFFERLRVRWAEIDAQQIVFNGHYLTYLDTAMGGYWRALALPYADTMKALEGDFFVRKATLEYLSSARYDDVVDVGMRCERIGSSSMLIECAVFRGQETLVHGELVYVFADPQTQTVKPVPRALRELFEGFEAGEAMVNVSLGDWASLGAQARAIRQQVFIDEQKIPAHLESDAADATGVHALALNRLGVALATGRLIEHAPGVGKIGRMAVLRTLRGGKLGRAVLDALMKVALERGYREVVLDAQLSAQPFFARAGFSERGPVFEEAGRAHIVMTRAP